jgi:hypothetical protein
VMGRSNGGTAALQISNAVMLGSFSRVPLESFCGVGAWNLMLGQHDGEFRASALSARAVWGIYRSPGAATQGKGRSPPTVRHT